MGKNLVGKFQCNECAACFTRRGSLKRHFLNAHTGGGQTLFCGMCRVSFMSKTELVLHRNEKHSDRLHFQEVSSSHNKACELLRLIFPDEIETLASCFKFSNIKTRNMLARKLAEKKFMKASLNLSLRFMKPDYRPADGDAKVGFESSEVITLHVPSKMQSFMIMNDISANLMEMYDDIIKIVDDFATNGSGWILTDCIALDIEIYQCKPLAGSCEWHSVGAKGNHIFIKNNAEYHEMNGSRCFFLAVASYFQPYAKTKAELDSWLAAKVCENIETPVRVKSIPKFEDANKHLDIAINVVFKSEDNLVYPVHASNNLKAKHIINLMLFFSAPPAGSLDSVLHYARILNINNLVAERKHGKNGGWHTRDAYLCFNCFSRMSTPEALVAHVKWCHEKSGQRLVLPETDACITYEKKQMEFKLGYIFFFDFETLQKTPDKCCSCLPEKIAKCKHKSQILAEHEAFAFSLTMFDRHSQLVEDISYVGHDAMAKFMTTLISLIEKYNEILSNVKPITMTPEQEVLFITATHCHICKASMKRDRVRDHDHLSGEYLGAAHNVCNLHRKECKKIVGFAHNFSGYDSHLIMTELGKTATKLNITAIPLNKEKFKMLKLDNCVLMDSMSFLNASLEKLVDTLKVSNHTFPLISQWLTDTNQRDLMLRKGVYPYEFVTDMSKVDACYELPPRDEFFSQLSGTTPSEDDYIHAQNVWNTFGCKSMRDYTELYVKADTFQLAEVMFQLRDAMYDEFGVDLCHYLSLPMMTKDIMLKTTGVKMELISDIEMIQMLRSNIRGGLSYVNQRHFDVEKETKLREEDVSLLYVDANNLYGAAMRFPLPLNDFQWMTEDEIKNFSMDQISKESLKGFILDVDLEYPPELHELHSSFPLAPHQMEITDSILSEYATNLLTALKKKQKFKSRKLTSTFLPRKNYVCHGLNLQYYLEQGMKLVKINRVISFRQECFLKMYIDLCTKKRANALTKAESDMYKLLCNSLYGKMIENGSNRMDCKFVTDPQQCMKLNSDPRLKGQISFSESFSVAFMSKKTVKLDQSWAVGFSILEISKYIMQVLMYDKLKPVFGNRASVILSDTDSWILAVPSASADDAMEKLGDVMDFSNYPHDHKLYNARVKNRTGYLKNEIPDDDIVEVVGVRSKCYAIKTKKMMSSKCKGVKEAAKKKIPFEAFVRCVQGVTEESVTQFTIQSKKHINRLMKCNKVAFSSFDDKRHLLCGIHSVPYGSMLIKKSRQEGECYFCKHPTALY